MLAHVYIGEPFKIKNNELDFEYYNSDYIRSAVERQSKQKRRRFQELKSMLLKKMKEEIIGRPALYPPFIKLLGISNMQFFSAEALSVVPIYSQYKSKVVIRAS
jgi:hypothetical protein